MSTPVRAEHHGQYFQAVKPRQGQFLNFTNSSKQSAAFYSEPDLAAGDAAALKGTTIIFLIADEDCWVSIGPDPTAVAPASEAMIALNSVFLEAGIKEYFGCEPGDKIAVIRDSADGTVYIGEAK